MRFQILATLLFLLPFSAQAAELKAMKTFTGRPIVLDADTLLFGKTRVSLFGIAAPEMSELDGWYARGVVDDILEGYSEMTCTQIAIGKDKRPVAFCNFIKNGEGYDLAIEILFAGVASVNRFYSYSDGETYAVYLDAAEAYAREDRIGFWARAPKFKKLGAAN